MIDEYKILSYLFLILKVCKYYAENLKWVVDKFHIKGHVEPKCDLSHPDCKYHPDHQSNKDTFSGVNMEVKIFRENTGSNENIDI